MVTCFQCGKEFDNYKELAGHILASNDSLHQHRKNWAANYLAEHGDPNRQFERYIRYKT